MPPVGAIGSRSGFTTFWPEVSFVAAASSPIVLPLTVIALPSRIFASRRRLRTRRIPPALSMSTAVYLPHGFMSARSGVRELILSKSSSVRVTPASRATARRWSTAFVDPPVAMTARIAFSIAGRVMICRGRTSSFRSSSARRPAAFMTSLRR